MDDKKRLKDVLEEAALAGATELTHFLTDPTKAEPQDFRRAQMALGAVTGYTRWRSSQNNLLSMVLMVSRQNGVLPDLTEIAESIGLPPSMLEPPEQLPVKKVKKVKTAKTNGAP